MSSTSARISSFLTVAHHLHVDHGSGPGQASRRHHSVHVGDHATGSDPLAHHRPRGAPHGPLWTPALLHGAPHRPVIHHAWFEENRNNQNFT